MQVVVNNLLTSYSRLGDGKNIILFLHGWADTSKTFEQLAAQVIKENPSYSAILVDLPGFGNTQTPAEAWGLEQYAYFIASFTNKLKADPKVILGHSNGGAIAIYGLANNIFKADKLVLVASAGIRQDTAKKQLLRAGSKPAKLILKAAPKTVQAKLKSKLYGAIGSDYLVAEHMQETFKKIVGTDVQADARRLQIPSCLIYGEDDTATPITYAKQFNQIIPNSELHTIELAGHFVHQEQVYQVATIIHGFLQK